MMMAPVRAVHGEPPTRTSAMELGAAGRSVSPAGTLGQSKELAARVQSLLTASPHEMQPPPACEEKASETYNYIFSLV